MHRTGTRTPLVFLHGEQNGDLSCLGHLSPACEGSRCGAQDWWASAGSATW